MLDITPFADHLDAPRGRSRLSGWAHAGRAGGAACGDSIELRVRLEGHKVAEAGFDASGCAAARAAGSAVVEIVAGRPLLEAARLSPAAVAHALGGLSPERSHAAALAADALHGALGSALREGAGALEPCQQRTLVAMSGGVDSAAAAQLALDRGDDVLAVTLELWADPSGDGTKSCCSPQAVTHARALAHGMGLPHVTLDLRAAFRADVVADFISEHRAGRTPNPCVRCNGLVRFDAMLALAERLGAARLVTGHYASVARDGRGPLLRAAADRQKDQTYMLARLGPDELERLWFPLAELTKPEVREVARRAGLPVADRAESQDLCFLAGVGKERFLDRSSARRPGAILSEDGAPLGSHAGQEHFTVGQRRGLGVAATEPLFVLRKEASSNSVWVGPRERLATQRVAVRDARLHRDGAEVDGVKLRYRSAPLGCRVEGTPAAGEHAGLTLALERAVHGVAPGQTACLMAGDRVVGHGVIAASTEASHGVIAASTEASHGVTAASAEVGHGVTAASAEASHGVTAASAEASHGVTAASAEASHGS